MEYLLPMFRRSGKTPHAKFLVDKGGLLRQSELSSPLESGYFEKSQAFTVWVLALLGVFIFVTAPFALVMGIGELRAQNDGRRDPDGNRGWAQAGTILGGVATILWSFILILIAYGSAFNVMPS